MSHAALHNTRTMCGRVGYVVALLVSLRAVASGQENPFNPRHAAEVVALWQELQAIDSWECDLFKPKAWDAIAESLEWALSRPRPASQPVADWLTQIKRDNFAILRESPNFHPQYEAYRKAIEAAAADSGKGELTLQLQDTTVEVLWTLQHIGPMLELALDAKLESDPNWAAKAGESDVKALVEEAIRRFAANQRRLNKLRILLDLPLQFRQLLGIEAARYAKWLEEWDGPDITSIEELKMSDLRATRVDARVLRDLETSITKELVRIKALLEPKIPNLQQAIKEVQRAAKLLYVDCPPGAADDAPRLRFVLKWPDNADGHSYPSADLVLVIPRSATSPVTVRDPSDAAVKKPDIQVDAPAADEYPLGIRIGQVAVNENEIPRILAGPLNNISVYDSAALAASLQRLGLPRELNIVSLDVIPSELRHDRVPLVARVQLPIGDAPIRVQIVIEPAKLRVGLDARNVLRTIAAEQFKKLQDELIARLQAPELQLVTGAGAAVPTLKVEVVDGNWLDGRLSARATIQVMGTDWVVPLLFEHSGARWRIAPGPILVPGTIADQIRNEVKKRLQSALSLSQDDFRLLQDYLTVEDLGYDPKVHQVSGVARFTFDLTQPAITADAPFSLRLSDGSIRVDFTGIVKELKDEVKTKVLDAARMAVKGAVDRALLERIKAASFDVAGLMIRVASESVKPLTNPGETVGGFSFDAEVLFNGKPLEVGGKPLRVRSLYLTSVDIGADGKLKSPKFDFSNCRIKPGPEHLLGAVSGLKPEWLKISQERGTPSGFSFFAELQIKGLDWPVHLGQFKIETDGLQWSSEKIAEAISAAVTKSLAGKNLVVGDVGPVKNLKLNELSIDPLRVVFAGDVELPAGLTLQMKIQVLPIFSIDPVGDPLQEIEKTLLRLVPDGTIPVVTRFELLKQKPYGVEFDIKVDAWCFTIEAKKLQIRQDGIHLPGTLRVTIPATVPLPGGLAIVNPGVGIPLGKSADGGKLEILGDITFGGQGLDKILRVASEMSGSPKDLRFEVQGRTILLNVLPIFQVQGLTELGKGRFEVNAQTVGYFDKLFSVRGQQVVDGGKKFVSQDAQLAILGFRVANVPMRLEVSDGGVHLNAKADIKLPIASAAAQFEGTFPKLADMKATAGITAKVSRFTLSNALVEIQWSRARLGFEVLSVKLTIITPGPLGLTPSTVLKAILKIFDFNLDFSALLDREITVNLVDETGNKSNNAIGDGEPPPPGDPTEDNTNPGGMPPTSEEKEKRDATADPPPGENKNEERQPAKKPLLVTPGHPQVPTEVYAYRQGSQAMVFEDLTNGVFRIIMVSEGGHKWPTHWTVATATKKHLEGDNLILEQVGLRTVDDKGNGRWTCVNGIQHDWMEAFVTLQQSGSDYKVHAVPLRPDLPVQELQGADNPIPEILKNAPGQTFWEWITGQSRPLQPGDILLIKEWARAQLDNRYQGFGKISQQDVATWSNDVGVKLAAGNGYFFQRVDDRGRKSAIFTTRDSGFQMEAAEGELLYYCINAGNDDHLRKLFLLFLESRLIGRGISFVHTGELAPNEPETQLDRVLLHLHATKDRPAELVLVTRGQPSAKRARLHLPWDFDLRVDPKDNLMSKLAESFDALSPEDIWVGMVANDGRALLAGKLAADDWWMMPIYFEGPPADRVIRPEKPGEAKVAGSVIADRYKGTEIAIGQSPRILDTEQSRRWFAERLFDEPRNWAKHLQDNPLPLALPGK